MAVTDEKSTVHFRSVVPHVSVPDVVEAAEYYRDKLGFDIAGYWDGENQHLDPTREAFFGIVRRDDVSIHFNRGEQSRSTSQLSDGGYDLYFHVANVTSLAKELRSRGADIVDGPSDRIYNQRELVLRDCNGLVLAFGEPIDNDSPR